MEIQIIGNASQLDDAKRKFGETHHYELFSDQYEAAQSNEENAVLFDFNIGNETSSAYRPLKRIVVFADTTLTSLSHLRIDGSFRTVFGFCGMNTFLNRDILEVSILKSSDQSALERICKELGTKYQVVADKVGLVTPRVICMIINEAFYTVEEGTAIREDIDKAMKLGTSYPYGPFEWSERIGKKNVCDLLDAVYKDTGDTRYRISNLLLKEVRFAS